jgi:hypothetical protein
MSTYRAVPCRSCQAWVIWADTEAGNRMPVDARPTPLGSVELRVPRGRRTPLAVVVPEGNRVGRTDLRMPHHATCPHGAAWRRT